MIVIVIVIVIVPMIKMFDHLIGDSRFRDRDNDHVNYRTSNRDED